MKKSQIERHSNPTVAVVLNVFRRGANFQLQLEAIKGQTYKVEEILVWENGVDSVAIDPLLESKHARSETNLGVWARFAFALNAKSDFVWIIDDDVIPGTQWLENAMSTFDSHNGVIGSRGLRFRGDISYSLYDEYGAHNPNGEVEQVDIVGHNWLFPRRWLSVFWQEYGNAFNSDLAGEDIHLSFAVQKHLGLGTFVPPHPSDRREMWGELQSESLFDGTDKSAISKQSKSLRRFENAYRHYIKLGFRPLVHEFPGNHSHSLKDLGVAKALYIAPKLTHLIAKIFRMSK